jgi:hypothetical protein
LTGLAIPRASRYGCQFPGVNKAAFLLS